VGSEIIGRTESVGRSRENRLRDRPSRQSPGLVRVINGIEVGLFRSRIVSVSVIGST
jgi:hypothetical protein